MNDNITESGQSNKPSAYAINIELDLVHLRDKMVAGTWSSDDTVWLDENIRFFDTGMYLFEPNHWYDLAFELAAKGMRTDLWLLCVTDIAFNYPKMVVVPAKFDDPRTVQELVNSWCYQMQQQSVHPKWDEQTQTLRSVANPTQLRMPQVLELIGAFASPTLMAAIHSGLMLTKELGLPQYQFATNEPSDVWRFVSWVLSPAVLGSRKAMESIDIENLDLAGPG